MMTTTSQEIRGTTAGSPKRTSENNLLAILFFLMGAPHIYGFIQGGSKRRRLVKADSNRLSLLAQLLNLIFPVT